MSQRKRQHRKTTRTAAAHSPLQTVIHPDAAGIDVGATELVCAVPAGRGPGPHVRTFSAFTAGLHALRDWLVACGIKTVAMESTGNYWLCACLLIEDAGVEVCLVNARHVKGVPGKKTDVCDAAWLQQLHAAGLLRGSFRPNKEILPLRYLMRHRGDLLHQAAEQVQLMQKVLTEMNLHIHHVFSDVDGESAQRIITAILGGERDARCRAPLAKVLAALQGDFRPEYLFVLRQCQERWRQLGHSLTECDAVIARQTAAVSGVTAAPLPAAPAAQRRVHKNMPQTMPVYAEAFASWLGLCPDNRISGGRVLKARTRKVANRIATILRLAANSLSRAEGPMGDYVRRFKGRLGKAEGIVAGAHKLARIIWAMIISGEACDESKAFAVSASTTARRLKNLQHQAQALNMKLVPV